MVDKLSIQSAKNEAIQGTEKADDITTSNSLNMTYSRGFDQDGTVITGSTIDLKGGDDKLNFRNLANTGNTIDGGEGDDNIRIPIPISQRDNYTFTLAEDGSLHTSFTHRDETRTGNHNIEFTNTLKGFEHITIGDVGNLKDETALSVKEIKVQLQKALETGGKSSLSVSELLASKAVEVTPEERSK